MKTLYEIMREVRGVARERNPALLRNAEILSWIDQAARDTARETACFERKRIVRMENNVQFYTLSTLLPGYLGKIRQVWYRDHELKLADTKFRDSSLFISKSSLPERYHYDQVHLSIDQVPTVTEYSTGTATFTLNDATVEFAGGADLVTAGIGASYAIGQAASPYKFYAIDSRTDLDTLELQEPYAEATSAASAYLITDGALRVFYVGEPDTKTRFAYTSPGTATFTKDSRTVTGSLTTWLDDLAVGMYIGRGNTTTDEVIHWYRITAIASNTSMTLSEPFAEATAASASFTVSDAVPLLHGHYTAPLYYAITMAYTRYNNAKMAAYYRNLYETEKSKIAADVKRRYSEGEGFQIQDPDGYDALVWNNL